ncbi:PEP-CTERM sorting domain-containing protein [Rugamonas sp. FT107W]|uniref:PEP-CTERM sorting domain-containing protein n=1 Tax=Duganella vulcania TaxID=2692166 RepID=A0A845HPU3_9BURK|nr:PEP-CTERM sorting domain-containing protein [Duganella vulcania]MYN19439.1 PEP-CTERM sorting domain-containing protein [Duganella vulcania]
MSIKLFAAAAIVALTVFATQAHAGQTWTVTTTGTIDEGADVTGVFGMGPRNLAGLSFTQSVTSSLDDGSASYFSYFSDTVTIDGHTVTLSPYAPGYDTQAIENGISKHNGSDVIYSHVYGYTAARNAFTVSQYAVNSTKSFVPSADYAQVLGPIDVSDPSFTAYSGFSIQKDQWGDGSEYAWFQSRSVRTISVNAVPEPEAYAMLLAGLGLVGFAARRKRMAA